MKLKLFLIVIFFIFNTQLTEAAVQTPKKGVAGIDYNGAAETVTPPEYKALGISWFYSWHAADHGFDIAKKSCTEFVPMIRVPVSANQASLLSLADNVIVTNQRKGLYWLVGNEPDMTATQDSDGYQRSDLSALLDQYVAIAKHIKSIDPTAKIIIGGFVTISDITQTNNAQPPALNMARILNDKLKAQSITPAGWHIHLYNCCNVEDFKKALSTWKDWQNRVLGGGETWITEFGSLVLRSGMETFMKQTVNLIETTTDNNYKVDRFAWFQTPESSTFPGGLFNVNHQITSLGSIYASLPTNGPAAPACLASIPAPALNAPSCKCNGTSLSSIDLTWTDNSTTETGYKTMRRNYPISPQNPWVQQSAVGPNTTSWSDTNVTDGSTYRYKVRSYIGDPTETAGADSGVKDITCGCGASPTTTPPTSTPTPPTSTPTPTFTPTPPTNTPIPTAFTPLVMQKGWNTLSLQNVYTPPSSCTASYKRAAFWVNDSKNFEINKKTYFHCN